MKLASFAAPDGRRWGVVDDDGITPIEAGAPAGDPRIVGEMLRDGGLDAALARSAVAPAVPLPSVSLLPPIPETAKIICVGLNYADHIEEMGRPRPERPVVFSRWSDSLVGHGAPLVRPAASERFDYEGEFAVVIGEPGRRISAADALDHVFGYTIMNDGSIRDYQRHTHQFTPGKNFPRSGSLGPFVVTRDEFGPVSRQRILTRVNGRTVQRSSLDQLVFGVAELVAYCSEWTDLAPGDVIATGTPGGVGDSRDPELWLRPGDRVEVEIEGLGALANPVSAEGDD